jgi:outer membrane immunogenic protein
MRSRHFGAIAISLAFSIGSALAADLPSYKAPPPPPLPPPPLWTGFYVGLNAGGTWSDSNSVYTATAPAFNAVLSPVVTSQLATLASAWVPVGQNGGFIGGGQIGYNWQFGGSFVAGIEADIQGVTHSGNAGNASTFGIVGAVPVVTTLSSTKTLDYLGTVRGRIGWLFTPTLLVYGTGGLAYGGANSATSIQQVGLTNGFVGLSAGSFSDTRVGWTAGGGIEWMFLPNWSAKVEYLYYDLGNVTYSGAMVTAAPVAAVPGTLYALPQSNTRFRGDIVRAGVNYHFNWGAPAPVVAKY